MTLFTSDTDPSKKALKRALIYVFVSLFCSFFGAVYEIFSHGVYSFFMVYSFLFPLVGGALPYLLLATWGKGFFPLPKEARLIRFGIAALTVGSIVRGILEIYGTTNCLSVLYWIVGWALCAAGVFLIVKRIFFPTK